ncbi:MAG: hypothetical protein LBQ66_10685 [Planctomycetaceae bacterium]|nr:hypothetical protein [Planctomycetaceae bacterium]
MRCTNADKRKRNLNSKKIKVRTEKNDSRNTKGGYFTNFLYAVDYRLLNFV